MITSTRKFKRQVERNIFLNFSKSPWKLGHQSFENIRTRHLYFVDLRLLGFLRAKNQMKRLTVAGRIGFPYLT